VNFQSHSRNVVPEVLAEYGAATRAALGKYLPRKEPQRYLYDLVADYPGRGGKMMRPSICIANARAFGGRIEDAINSAVSLELLHNALLIHDDIEDESEERRGRPTLHAQHGVPIAINVGDALSLLSIRPLIDNRHILGPEVSALILQEADRVAMESAEGQAMELGWRADNDIDVTDEDYLNMVLKKTCWLATIYPSRVGATIGTQDALDPEAFIRFGFFLGAAFQIQDDLLNLFADDRYGKERDGDLWEGKRTLMLIHTLSEAKSSERDRIRELLATERHDKEALDVQWLHELMNSYGSIEYARQVAHGLAGAALEEFERVYARVPDSRDKEFIKGLITWVFERN
jgi:geranylgeranyl diphosphate synthase type II